MMGVLSLLLGTHDRLRDFDRDSLPGPSISLISIILYYIQLFAMRITIGVTRVCVSLPHQCFGS